MKVNLETIVDAVEMSCDSVEQYYHIPTGEVVTQFEYDYDEELADELGGHWDEYLHLPSQFDINEYQIMEQFIENLDEGHIKERFKSSVHGRCAFRRFKDMINDYNIADNWYKFLEKAHRKIAIEWCEENNIEYEVL